MYGALDGGVEKIDLATRRSTGWLTREEDLGGDLIDFALGPNDRGYATIADLSSITVLVAFDARTGARRLEPIHTSAGYDLADLAVTACGYLIVCDRTYTARAAHLRRADWPRDLRNHATDRDGTAALRVGAVGLSALVQREPDRTWTQTRIGSPRSRAGSNRARRTLSMAASSRPVTPWKMRTSSTRPSLPIRPGRGRAPPSHLPGLRRIDGWRNGEENRHDLYRSRAAVRALHIRPTGPGLRLDPDDAGSPEAGPPCETATSSPLTRNTVSSGPPALAIRSAHVLLNLYWAFPSI